MSINCANITSEEYLKLKAKFGENKANYLWNKLNGEIPEDINTLVDVEFKKAQILMPHTIVKTLAENGIDVYKLSHEEIQKIVSKEVLEGISYRIPNQAAASNDTFEIVGILPENAGDTIIAFKEITTKTGSDFDIDKAYIMLPNYYYNKETKRLEIQKDNSKEGLQNKRLDIASRMLSDPKGYAKLMKPLDTDWLKKLILGTKTTSGLIKEEKKIQDLDFWTGTNQVKTKSLFDATKTLVGPIAKTMTNHNAIKHEGIRYKDTYLGKGKYEEITEETVINENFINNTENIVNNPKEFINYSGGAQGSDTEWEIIGAEYGIGKQVNYRPENLDKLNDKQLKEIEDAYVKTVKDLGRKVLSKDSYSGKLVRRDYLQAKAADSIFAIIEGFDNNNLPKGGTAYATMMTTDMKKPVHIFNQEDKTWYEAKYTEDDNFYGFEQSVSIPVLTPKYAGIGTREINESGKQAIKDVYEKTFNNTESQKTAEEQPTNNSRTITKTKKESLVSTEKDEAGNDIEETLTGYMNAIVDGVKDPYIVKGNINLFTGNIAFMLARAGVDRNWISTFMVQPILVDLVNQMAVSESRISEKTKGTNGETIQALDVILKKYGENTSGKEFKTKVSTNNLKNESGDITITTEDLIKELNNPNNETQIKVLKQFMEYQKTAFLLGDLMTIMSADTDGATKNAITAEMRNNLMNEMISNESFTNLPTLLGYGLDASGKPIFNDTKYIGTFHKNSVQFLQTVAKQKFVTSSDSFKTALFTIARYAGHKKLKSKADEELAKVIENELFAAFIEESKILSFDNMNDLKTLLFGSESQKTLAHRVLEAQKIHTDNLFLQSLEAKPNEYFNGKPSTVSLSPHGLDVESKNDLYLYWEDLLNIDKQLGEDLIKYAYYSSGFSPNFGVFFEHIPTNWLIQNGLNDFMKEKLQSLNQTNTGLLHLKDQVFRHLYKNNKIVPTVSSKIITKFVNQKGEVIADVYYLTIPEFNASILEIGENEEGNKEYKQFVKRHTTNPDTLETSVLLYQLKGYTTAKDTNGKDLKTLLYERVSPLGTNKGIDIIKEYGNTEESIFSANKIVIPPFYKEYVDTLKIEEPKPINILHNTYDESNIKENDIDENDLIFCQIE